MTTRFSLLLALAVAVAALAFVCPDRSPACDDLKTHLAALRAQAERHPIGFRPGILVGLFGLIEGTLIVSFAASLGALLAFLATRYLFGDGRLDLFSLRPIPVVPFFPVGIAMGHEHRKEPEAAKYAAGAWHPAHAPHRLLDMVARFHRRRRG